MAKPREDWAYTAPARPATPGRAARPAQAFVFMEEAVLALNIAMATRRPLLISGEPGGGKTSLALFAALALGRKFYRQTVTSRTQVTDLLSSFDAVGRLGDAQRQVEKSTQSYLSPGALWWALSPTTAAQRGREPKADATPLADPSDAGSPHGAVLLLDEIDKADPDVPNDLLEVLDERQFTIPETRDEIVRQEGRDLLIMLTTNDERELPAAFLRRCVTLELPEPPGEGWLVDIAKRRYPDAPAKAGAKAVRPRDAHAWDALYFAVATELIHRRKLAGTTRRRKPSIAEFLDAIAACRELAPNGAQSTPVELRALLDSVLVKDRVRSPAG